jgi:hypothetical protein
MGNNSLAPKRKVVAGVAGVGLGAALAGILVWLLGMWGVDVPPDVQGYFDTLLSMIVGFASGYLVPE